MNKLKNKNIVLIFASIFFSSFPVLFFMEPATIFIISIPFFYNILIIFGRINPPGRKLLIFLTLFFTTILAFNFRQLFSRDAGVPLLIIMSLLKILEAKNLRDELVACFLSFFILLSMILFSSSFFTTIYMFLSAVFTISVIGYINSPDKNFYQNFKKSILISIPALFFAFTLFFFFPRIQTSFWGKQTSSKHVSGFAQTIIPGSVSSLAKSNEIAFKIKFEEKNFEKYFRGIVFNSFDGKSWLPDKPPKRGPKKIAAPDLKNAFIVLYPTYSKYLISPDYPLDFHERGIYLTNNSTLYSWYFKINDKKLYEIEYTNKPPVYPKPTQKHLKLPSNFNPKALELGLKWQNFPPEQRIEKALNFFKQNNFKYTLTPPSYGKNYIDEFLFETKKGFCEHFASSFAFLMRASNVPSRIVGGYLGGQQNSIGDFINVKQSDAHAWCEVWIENKGWVRIDPTTESEPSRLDSSTSVIFSSGSGSKSIYLKIFEPVLNLTDALNFFWAQKVMGYNFSLQNKFFEFLGLKNQNLFKKSGLFIFVICMVLSIFYLIFKLKTKINNKKSQELILFNKLQKKIKNKNFVKNSSEGYLEYLKKIEAADIKDKKYIKEFLNLMILQRYNEKKSENIKKMKKLLKKISI
jgi:transglutaminase-like putative cysteine protease